MTRTRRAFVSVMPAALGLAFEKGPALQSEMIRYADPATEFPVVRLTDPKHTSVLPDYFCRVVSRRGSFLLYSNDRTGVFQPYRLDLKSGQSHQIAELKDFQTGSLNLMPDEKSCCCLAENRVRQLSFSNNREREVYRIPEGFEAGRGFSISEDGLNAHLVEHRSGKWRILQVSLSKGSASTVVESEEELSDPMPRPRRAGLLFRAGNRELHVINYDGARNQRLRTAAGALGPALWSSDGRVVEYLNIPEDRKQLNNLRDYTADANEDRLIAPTTQYVHFGRNGDSTVFVGASGSKASPYLFLLVRTVKRELALCEHKATDARLVAPIFSPNSQRVFFQTDRHGKLAIYTMSVEKLVEQTE